MLRITLLAGLAALATPVLAEGDPAKGEREFNKCRACHMIVADDGTEIFKGGRTGPNLYGVIGRTAGTEEGFRYSPALVAAGEAGLVWDEENIIPYLADPTAFIRDHLGDSGARSNMTFKLARGGEDIVAYLISVSE
ncbi:c-type cytochrome [Plastorhodobacter daqingensis]|uniref:C-type cytochrome n=1 Tax=Plastorhodobacter daqingensis TaxID=1387281 RepID=A0ABW2UKZ7_9RHOB